MLICLGKATKLARFFTGLEKTYEAEIELGRISSTFDAEGVDDHSPVAEIPHLEPADIRAILKNFEGTITQTVPAFSAIHIGGKRLYELAREGKEFDLPTREVEIHHCRFIEYDKPHLRIQVHCSKGTYIRSLANDIGREIGCGGFLSGLKRTCVGQFDLSQAITVDAVRTAADESEITRHIIPIEQVIPFGGAITISEDFGPSVFQGQAPRGTDVVGTEGSFVAGDEVALKNPTGAVLAIGTACIPSADLPCSGTNREIFRFIRVLQ
jgi:tRNA pseudouridine55 synthase